MMHRLLVLSVVAGRPVVPGFPIVYGTGEMFTAHGPRAAAPRGALNRWCHPCRATLVPILRSTGTYRVWAEPADMAIIDPGSKGLTQSEWLAIAGNREKCTYWDIRGTCIDQISGRVVDIATVIAISEVPAQDASALQPWHIGNISITSAIPGIPSVRSGCDSMKTDISAAKAASLQKGR